MRILLSIILVLIGFQLKAQTSFVAEGTVYDENQKPLIGVTILIKGTQLGTTSDLDGKFKLQIPTQKATLRFSFIGYKTQELSVTQSDSKSLNIQLEEDVTALDDLIITGYNIKKDRTKLVGSAQQISGKQLQTDRPIESFDKMLSGQIAGLTVENVGGGELGVLPEIRIRGQGSLVGTTQRLTTSSEPLYVIDGVPIYDITSSNSSSSGTTAFERKFNPLAQFNPDDIESITVLKDASATAIYGANAANGVVLITTKRGQKGKVAIDLKYTTGVASAINQVELLNTQEYVMLYRETLLNSGFTEAEAIEKAGPTDIEVDWANISLQTAQFHQANLSLSGGGKNTSARLSLNYLNQEAISVGNQLERLGSRINVDMKLDSSLTISYSFTYNLSRRDILAEFGAINAPPNLSPYNADGSFNNVGRFEDLPNPLAVLAQNENNNQASSANGNITVSYQPIPNLTLAGLIGLDTYQNNSRFYRSNKNATGFNNNGALNLLDRNNFQWVSNLRANWGSQIGGNLNLTLLAGAEATEQTTKIVRTSGANFPYDDLRELDGALTRGGSSSRLENATVSYFGNANLEWKEKYLFNINTRTDISSIFGGDVSKGVFASVGAGWLLHKEPFLAGNSKISLLKLRASFGSTGNSRIGSFASRGLYRIGSNYGYAGQLGIGVFTPENPQLTWEKNYKTDISAELGLWQNRFRMTATYYQNDIIDAITSVSVPNENGFTSARLNAADMRNSGIEISVSATPILKEKINWTFTFNLASNKNIVRRIKIRDSNVTASSAGIGLALGEDVRTIYGIKYVGVNPENGDPQFLAVDGTLTNSIAVARENMIPLGSRNPNLFGGMNHTLQVGQFSFSLLTSFSFGSQIVVNSFYEQDGRQFFNNQGKNLLDRWQNPGDITTIPKLLLDVEATNSRVNSRFVYDNDYLKVENISVSYSVPRNKLQRLKLTSMNIFAQVSNVGYFYFTEQRENRNGIAQYRYEFPEARTISAGLKVGI